MSNTGTLSPAFGPIIREKACRGASFQINGRRGLNPPPTNSTPTAPHLVNPPKTPLMHGKVPGVPALLVEHSFLQFIEEFLEECDELLWSGALRESEVLGGERR